MSQNLQTDSKKQTDDPGKSSRGGTISADLSPLGTPATSDTDAAHPNDAGIPREEIAASLEKLFPRYGQMLRNLAK